MWDANDDDFTRSVSSSRQRVRINGLGTARGALARIRFNSSELPSCSSRSKIVHALLNEFRKLAVNPSTMFRKPQYERKIVEVSCQPARPDGA